MQAGGRRFDPVQLHRVAHGEKGVNFTFRRVTLEPERVSFLFGMVGRSWIKILETFIANISLVSDN